MQKKNFFRSRFGKMASTSYSAVEVLDLLDTTSKLYMNSQSAQILINLQQPFSGT